MQICAQDCWFTTMAVRTKVVKTLRGGIAQIIGGVLKLFFPQEGTHLAETGLHLEAPDGSSMRLFAELKTFVQDGAAHKDLWKCRDGSRQCMSCNALEFGSQLQAFNTGMAVNAIKHSSLKFSTDEEIRSKAMRLNAFQRTQGSTEFIRTQQVIGFTWSPYSILCDPALSFVKPVSHTMHDWMHTVFSGGVFNVCLHLLLCSIEAAGLNDVYNQLADYCSHWRFPKRISSNNLDKIFNCHCWIFD